MIRLVSFEIIQISSFWESQLISSNFAASSLLSLSKVTSKYDHVSKVHPMIDVFVLKYVFFVFLDYRYALIDVKWDHGRVCGILYPIE